MSISLVQGISSAPGISTAYKLSANPGLSGINIPTPTYFLNFLSGTLDSSLTFTRAAAANYFNSSGLLASAGVNVPRFDYGSPGGSTLLGLLLEPASTNQALWCRDLTQATWTLSNATTSLTQVGIDGIVNSASLITATAGNATVLQTVTQAAVSSVFSVYLKRISGTGVIQITQDGGSTFTTATLTAAWQRFQCVAQSTLNPQFGVKIVNSADSIAWDYSQFEPTTSSLTATSPIFTVNVPFSRLLEVCVNSSPSFLNLAAGTIVAKAICGGGLAAGNSSVVSVDNNSTTNRFLFNHNPGSGANAAQGFIVNNGVSALNSTATGIFPLNTLIKLGLSNKSGAQAFYANGIQQGTASSAATPSAYTQIEFGVNPGASYRYFGWVQYFAYWNQALSNTQLQSATA